MTEISRPILLGMTNPYGDDPKYALFPLPRDSAGGRLYAMLAENEKSDATPKGYCSMFDRRNLITGTWSTEKAREAGRKFMCDVCEDPAPRLKILVLGREVWRALGLPKTEFLGRFEMGASFWCVPHPSGRNMWYNDQRNRRRVSELLTRAYRGAL